MTYYEQNMYAITNNFAAFIKIISEHSITQVIVKTLTFLQLNYQH